MNQRRTGILLLLGYCCLLTSCAFGTRHVTLSYPPESNASTFGSGIAHAASLPIETVTLVQFKDERPDKNIIGEVRNGWGMKTADVVNNNSVTEWVTNAIASELGKGGFQVNLANRAEEHASGVKISGEVIRAYASAYLTYEGEVSFFATIEKDGKELLRKRYDGEGSAGLNWAMTATSYGNTLSEALSYAVRHFVEDVRATVK
ncbi:MAG: hypothetical protein HY447_02300 [Candidatus Omnitrophica bacterium]|nr:hypothetical protein [Candidatus Omnitrophota bacterium]